MVEDNFVTRVITLCFIAALFLVGLIVIKPIIISIGFGLLLAYVFYPIYEKIHARVKMKNISVILLILGAIIVIAIPLFFIVPILVRQTFETYLFVQKINFADILEKAFPLLSTETLRLFAVSLNNLFVQLFNSLLNQFTNFIVDFPNLMLQFAVVLFTFYFAVRDSDKLKEYSLKLSPFSVSTEKKFLEKFRQITNTILYGNFLIAILQGLAFGIGLLILGVPKVVILTVITVCISVIPLLGPVFVGLPVSIALIATGSIVQGVILFLYGALFVSSIDNILRPYLLSKKTNLPVPVALIGIIGGLYAFGIIGLVLGPLIFAYILIIFDFYREGKLNELFKE